MTPFERLRDLAESLTGHGGDEGTDATTSKVGSPAAAGGGSTRPVSDPGEISQGGSSMSDPATALGGADAVPGTPDATPSVRLDEGGEDHPHHEDHKSEDVVGQSPSENVSPAETDEV